MCACAQRRAALRVAAQAIVSGDVAKAADSAKFVVSSLRADASAAVTAARMRLKR